MSLSFYAAIAVTLGITAATTDLRSGRIPNWLTFSGMALGMAAHGIGEGLSGLLKSLVGAAFCAAVPGIVYKASEGRGIGGGDIKLFAALGSLLGPTQGLEAELSSFVLLGAFALFRVAFVGQLSRTIVTSLRVTAGLVIPKWRAAAIEHEIPMTAMRMGPAIAVAVVTVLALPYVTRWLPWLG